MAVNLNPESLPDGFRIQAVPENDGGLMLVLFEGFYATSDLESKTILDSFQIYKGQIEHDAAITKGVEHLVATATRISEENADRARAREVADKLNKLER